MISASRKKCRLLAIGLCYLKTKHIPVKRQSAVQIRHLEMHMADPYFGMKRTRLRVGSNHMPQATPTCVLGKIQRVKIILARASVMAMQSPRLIAN